MSVAHSILSAWVATAAMLAGDVVRASEPPQPGPETTEEALAADTQQSGERRMDEITVTGKETVPRLRGQLRRLDEAFFRRYNELNDVDDFDMICKRETWVGSQMPRRVCRSRLHRERLSESATDMLNENGIMSPVSESWRSRHYDKVRDNVTRVLGEDAALAGMMAERAAIRRRIEALKKQ